MLIRLSNPFPSCKDSDDGIQHYPEWQRFRYELHYQLNNEECPWRRQCNCLSREGFVEFSDKVRADEFVEFLMTFDSWTEDYCPIRLKVVK